MTCYITSCNMLRPGIVMVTRNCVISDYSLIVKSKFIRVLNSLNMTPWRRMGEWRFSSSFLDLSTRWWWVVNLTPRLLNPRGKSPSIRWIGGWMGLRASLDAVDKRKISRRCRELNPSLPARSSQLYWLKHPSFWPITELLLRDTAWGYGLDMLLRLGYSGGSCEGGDEFQEKAENFLASCDSHLRQND
jgi:hypothetical protein